MKPMGRVRGMGAVGVGLLLLAAGCAGAEPVRDIAQDLGSSEALPVLRGTAWRTAPAGCEGVLSGTLSVSVVGDAPELVGVFDARGVLRCVDGVEAVLEELERTAGPDVSNRVGVGYLETVALAPELSLAGRASSDPSPQPNLPWQGLGEDHRAEGDPSPQPNTPTSPMPPSSGASSSDPSPQPNTPPTTPRP